MQARFFYISAAMPTPDDQAKRLDLLKVHQFLLDDKAVKAQLIALEKILEQRAGERFNPQTKQFQGFTHGQPCPHHKLLSSYLDEWAQQNGFNPSVRLKKLQKDFDKQLLSKSLFKDNVLRGAHGEFSHFIQWWCIVEHFKHSAALSCTPAELYKWIGIIQQKLATNKIWGEIFEVQPGFEDEKFISQLLAGDRDIVFRLPIMSSVLYFNSFLKSKAGEALCPLLSQLLQGRDNKGGYVAREGEEIVEGFDGDVMAHIMQDDRVLKITSTPDFLSQIHYADKKITTFFTSHLDPKNSEKFYEIANEYYESRGQKLPQHIANILTSKRGPTSC